MLLAGIAATIGLYLLLRGIKVEEPGISFEPVTFAAIEGWEDDDALTFDDDAEEIDDAGAADDGIGVDRDAPTQALRIVPAEPEVDDRDNLELFSDHEITAEVPITPAPAPGGMRIVGDDEAR